MFKALIIVTLAINVFCADLTLLDKNDLITHSVSPIPEPPSSKVAEQAPLDQPVYRPEEHHEVRARIAPVRPRGPVIRHEQMLADEPSGAVDRADNQQMQNYGYVPIPEVAYPDIPYAPGYGYDTGYSPSNSYEVYSNSPSNYLFDPDTSAFSLLWSQVPDSRTIVSYVGRTIYWVFSSIFVLLLGSFITVGVCSYTNLCAITFNGVGPIHEEMRSLITPERLEKISHAADFVKTAIDKYQKIQTVPEENKRAKRSFFYK